MTSLSVAYRHSGHFRPLFLKNSDIEETASAVRAQLDEVTFTAAWGKGQALSLDEAARYAIAALLT